MPWSYAASKFYHDVLWLRLVGRKRISWALDTGGGRLFQRDGDGVNKIN